MVISLFFELLQPHYNHIGRIGNIGVEEILRFFLLLQIPFPENYHYYPSYVVKKIPFPESYHSYPTYMVKIIFWKRIYYSLNRTDKVNLLLV